MNDYNLNVFDKISAPVIPFLEESQNNIPNDAAVYTLSFLPFTVNILSAIINRIPSVSLLVTDIKTSDNAEFLGLAVVSESMCSEVSVRYDQLLFRSVFVKSLTALSFLDIPEIEHSGQIVLIDGSLFPAISTMSQASYKSTADAVKMHLSFNLNKMIPAEFLAKEGEYSERKFLKDILQESITYICDRGYISFKIFKDISDKKAFFITLGKKGMLYDVTVTLKTVIPDEFIKFFSLIKDIKVKFQNDKDDRTYRIV
ncbi:transposase [Desulfococcaceae bacterium HSG7]|nr:transposase [Desulfococcaceae bacterium HSG7]